MSSEAHRRAAKTYRKNHPDRYKQANKNWKKSNPEQNKRLRRRYDLKRLYKLTEAEYKALLNSTPNCPGCGKEFSDDMRPDIDHDHNTGRVRGLLCHLCNLTLGSAGDNPAILKALAEYLERTSL